MRAPFNQNLFYQNALPRAPQEAEGIYTRLLGPQNQQGPGSKVNLLSGGLVQNFGEIYTERTKAPNFAWL